MSVPGPSLVVWAGALVVLVVLMAGVGEGVRRPFARWARVLRLSDPFERLLADLYLGGALVYLLAVVPVGGFSLLPLACLVVVALVSAAVPLARWARGHVLRQEFGRLLRPLARPAYLVTLLAAVGLGLVELLAAGAAPTGNTFDSSVDTLFVALLNLHGSLPQALAPVAAGSVAYPQGSTVWFALGQAIGSLPPPRSALLVTPFFIAIAPLGAFAIGRRWLGRESDGAAFALMMALLAPGTRYFAAGSNDFVLAFPLILLLAAWSREWLTASGPPSVADVVVMGSLLGYSAALNPVGAQWIGLAVPLALVLLAPSLPAVGRWAGRWLAAVGIGLLWVAPSLVGVARGATAPGPGGTIGIGAGAFVSLADPFVIRPDVLTFSPFVPLSLELALLLVGGAVALLWPAARPHPGGRAFGRWAIAGVSAALLWLATGLGASTFPPLGVVLPLTSLGEMSVLLFTVYSFVAAIPFAIVLREIGRHLAATPPPPEIVRPIRRRYRRPLSGRSIVAVGLGIALVMPGAVVTAVDLPAVLDDLYGSFSNVTAGDFALLAWAGEHLPAGARVLVAPGSAAEFLPGYAPRVVLLYPMTGPSWRADPNYLDLLHHLANGTLGANGSRDLATLDVQFVAVTGNSTVLYPAFSPSPFLSGTEFTMEFHDADAYLFARAPPPPPPIGV